MPDDYAVMGNPIAHSKSPAIHTMFAEQTRQSITYVPILVPLGGFEPAVESFRAAGGKGLNVTVPFKEAAFNLAAYHTPRAARARAVNTLWFDEDGLPCGDNTDGVGLVRDLTANLGVDLADRRVLLLGAGGAARGALGALLDEDPSHLVVANRTAPRAEALAREFTDLGAVIGCGLDDLHGESFDLVINATASSLEGEVPALPAGVLARGGGSYDMMYASEPTSFVHWGWSHGAAWSADGLGMLVEQAAESFLRWRGVRPETHGVIEAMRRAR